MGQIGLVFFSFAMILTALILVSVKIYQVKPDFIKKILKYLMIFGFIAGFSITCILMGFRIESRHSSSYFRNLKSVQEIWGGNLVQNPPQFYTLQTGVEEFENRQTGLMEKRSVQMKVPFGFSLQSVKARLTSNIRKKGILLFPGYEIKAEFSYQVKNPKKTPVNYYFDFALPSGAGNISGVSAKINGKPQDVDSNLADGFQWKETLSPGEERVFQVDYEARGTGKWAYALGKERLEVKQLEIRLATDFQEIRIPDGAMVPYKNESDGKETVLEWKSENLITGQDAALVVEADGNYGEVASKMFFYAPVALLLFSLLLVIYGASKELSLHLMHILFILTGFFIFYLLNSYLLSFFSVHLSMLVSLGVSSGIVLYYGFLIKKGTGFVTVMGLGLLVFQWLFSFAFFVPEFTGLIITGAAILSLLFLMKSTAAIQWENKW